MALDGELLKRAKAEGARLAEAERQLQLTRADYHSVIRRMHLGGGSLREIAHALALSHQRVQQIVDGAGGSWWQRVWRSRNVKRDAICTVCDRPPSEVARLVAGPNVYLCDTCIASAEEAITADPPGAGGRPWVLAKEGARVRCSFCARRQAADRPVLAAASANICGECLRLCRQILDDRAA